MLGSLNTRLGRSALVFLVTLLLLPVITHSIIDHPPEYDELLHILAARSVDSTSNPTIADGLYPRAFLFTKIVSLTNELGNSELVASRLPALIFGSLLVGLVGFFISSQVGWLAGLASATTLAVFPDTIHLSVLVRFYTLHALLMCLMLICIYFTLSKSPDFALGKRALTIVLAITFFFVGLQLQILTQITALAGASGALVVLLYDTRHLFLTHLTENKVLSALAGLAGIAILGYVFITLGGLDKLRNFTPAWSINKSTDFFFYIKTYSHRMPLFWPLFPLLAVFALAKYTRITLYFLAIILVSILFASIASQKATRYIFHTIPSVSIVMGLGLTSIITIISDYLEKVTKLRMRQTLTLSIAVVALCALNSLEVQRVTKLIVGKGFIDDSIPAVREPDWSLAKEALGPYINDSATVIASSGVKALYTFGRYDFELNRTVVDDTETATEFGFDGRTGRYVISTPLSISSVIDKPGKELIIIENRMLNQFYGVPDESVATISKACTAIQTPTDSQLSAWQCE